jgi:hypothetical protein
MKDSELLLLFLVIIFVIFALIALIGKIQMGERAEVAEARVERLETELEAARDSVLAGEIEGFNVRCYAVRKDTSDVNMR